MPVYGSKSSASPDYGIAGPGEVRVSVFNEMTEHGWAQDMGYHGGKEPADAVGPSVRIVCYETDNSRQPTNRVGYTDVIVPNISFGGVGGGDDYSANIVESTSTYAPIDTSFPLYSGRRYGLGFLPVGKAGPHGMIQENLLSSPDNARFYYRTGQSVPPHPMGFTSSSIEGWLRVWIDYVANRTPTAAMSGPSGSISSLTPTLSGTFDDADEVYGDRLEQYQFKVRRADTLASVWSPGAQNASTAQQSSDSFTQAYSGPSLTSGVTYEVACRVSDFFGTWSAWSSWMSFTVGTGPITSLVGNPLGKIEAANPAVFQGKYHHPAGTGANAVQVRLLQNGVVVQTGAIVAKTVASSASPGTTFTITWAEAGLTVSAGVYYDYQIRSRSTTNVWGDWSATTSNFVVNAPPLVPSGASPIQGSSVTGLPIPISWFMSDPDDTVATGLTMELEITRPDASVVTVAPTYNAGANRWDFSGTVTQFNQFGTYSMRARGFDGTVNGPWSPVITFAYLAGVSVTPTFPTSGAVIVTTAPTFQWTISGGGSQVSKRLRIYDSTIDPMPVIYDTGVVTGVSGAVLNHQPSGGFLENGAGYLWQVEIANSIGQSGFSPLTAFSVVLPEVAAIENFTATPVLGDFDAEATNVLLSWGGTDFAPGTFVEYVIRRHRKSGPPDLTPQLVIARLKSPAQTRFVDTTPISGIEYRYRINQTVRDGADIKDSPTVYADQGVTLTTTTVASIKDPTNLRAVGLYWSARAVEHLSESESYLPWNASLPTVIMGRQSDQVVRMTVRVVDDDLYTARQYIKAWEDLYKARDIVCYRDPKGRKVFGVLRKLTVSDERGGIAAIEFELQQVNFVEGFNQ